VTESPDDLLELFERLSLDKKLSFFIPSRKGERVVVLFDLQSEKPWSLSLENAQSETKRTVTRRKLPEVLEALDCEWGRFEDELSAHLLWQASYCDHFIREVSDLLGGAAVQAAILQTQTFMDDITEAVSRTLGAGLPPTPPSQSGGQKRSRFRVIRNPS
jgi:hypothetical protein